MIRSSKSRNNLAMYVASLGKRPTTAQKRDTIGKRDVLQKRIGKFQKLMLSFIRKHHSDESDDEDASSNDGDSSDDGNRNDDDQMMIADIS